jgi:hypothetical protein
LKEGDSIKKAWQKPELEVLDISMTMGGPGSMYADTITVHNEDLGIHLVIPLPGRHS